MKDNKYDEYNDQYQVCHTALNAFYKEQDKLKKIVQQIDKDVQREQQRLQRESRRIVQERVRIEEQAEKQEQTGGNE